MPPYHPNCLEALIHVTYPRSLTKIANTNHTRPKAARFGLGGRVTGASMPGGKVAVTLRGSPHTLFGSFSSLLEFAYKMANYLEKTAVKW